MDKKLYMEWLSKLPEHDPLREELLSIGDQPDEIRDRFYKEITFGTAGLRGRRGAGTNRMNVLTVGRAIQGIANYIVHTGVSKSRGVVIAFDCRHFSGEFAKLAAEILAGNGIKVYLFPSMRSTPELSFTIRSFAAAAGINMTASHNPPEYNGCKVYWEDGAQISGEISDGIQKEIGALHYFDRLKKMPLKAAVEERIVRILGDEIDLAFLDYVMSMRQRGDEELDLTIPVVYTPLYGAGSIPMQWLAKELGYTNFIIVPQQRDPDPDFTTVGDPNPENPQAFRLAEEIGREQGADVLIATDPDSDRMAVEVADGEGGYIQLNGNQTGALLIAYMAQSMQEKGTLPEKAAMIKSIVTGDMGKAICESYGIRVFETLTGFKNICALIPRIEEMGYEYFFAYEESIGCAPSDIVRDKDGITASMLVMEMAAWCRRRGITLAGYLDFLYKRFGYYAEEQVSLVLDGETGEKTISSIMDTFRNDSPASFGNYKVESRIDLIEGYEDLPASNVLVYHLDHDSWFAMRPSGTEPKIKFYYYTRAEDGKKAADQAAEMKNAVSEMVQGLIA